MVDVASARTKIPDQATPEQQEETARSVAIKRVLSESTNLSLYEKRTAGRRDRTIRKLMNIKQTLVSRVEE